MKIINALLSLLVITSGTMFCMNPETTDLELIVISDIKSLQNIVGEMSHFAEDNLSCYVIQPTCMAAYMRHRENIETIPTQQEIDFYKMNKETECYQQLTHEVLREVHAQKMGMVSYWNGTIHFYAKKEEDRRVELITKFATMKKKLPCAVVTCIGVGITVIGLIIGLYAGSRYTSPCRNY